MSNAERTMTSDALAPAPASVHRAVRRQRWRVDRRTLVLAALALTLAAGVFAGHYALEVRFAQLYAFNQFDVLFDSDPVIRLTGFAHGWGVFSRNLFHPNLANFVNPPLRFIARALQMTALPDIALPPLREALALLVNPFFAALQALALLVFFLRLGFSRPVAFLLALLGACTFSQIVFGSIPEHYGLSAPLLTLAFLLTADLLDRRGEVNWPAWLFVGWLIAGITISNLVSVGLLFWVALRFCRRPDAVRQTALLVAAVGLLTFASYLLLNLGYDAEPQPTKQAFAWSLFFVRSDAAANLLRFPTAVADTIAPPEPDVTNIRYLRPRNAHYAIQFTFAETPPVFSRGNWLGSGVLLLLVAGAIGHFRAGGTRRALLWGSLAVLAFNALFHAFWGHEYFLYSQHWLTAALFLAAGVYPARSRSAPAALALLALVIALVALNNYLNMQQLLTTMANAPNQNLF